MPAFSKGEIYDGMMQNFAHIFGNAITALPTGKTKEVAFGSTQTYAGVSAMQKPPPTCPARTIGRCCQGVVLIRHYGFRIMNSWHSSCAMIQQTGYGSSALVNSYSVRTQEIKVR